MNERTRKYTLERLSELTEVQERTIRAYIAQGLLPSPVGKGRGAYYSEVHRKRLKIIKQLRDRYGLPLDQIRQHLMMAGEDEEVQIVPVTLRSPLAVARAAKLSSDTDGDEPDDLPVAMDFELSASPELRNRIRRGSQQVAMDDELSAAPELSAPPETFGEAGATVEPCSDSRLEQLVTALQRLVNLGSRGRGLRSETCSLVEVTPDISLLIKGNYAPHEVALFEQLAESLREALTRGLVKPQQKDDD